MRLFGRKNNVETVPQEVREYYEAERRERTGLAWLLALGTLVVTLLIASGLFFGGRWAYHKIADKNDKKTVATQTQSQDNSQPKFEATKTDDKKTDEKATTTTASNGTPGAATGTSSTRTDTPSTSATKTTPAPTAAAPAPAATPTTTPKTLVNTGPADIIVIFVTIAAAGTLYHRFVLSRL